MVGMGMMTRLRLSGPAEDLLAVDVQLPGGRLVLVVDEPHDGHDDGDDDRHQERLRSLADEHDDEHDGGHQRPHGVDAQAPAPAAHAVLASQCRTMPLWLRVKAMKTPTE